MGDPYKGKLAGHALILGSQGVRGGSSKIALCECWATSTELKMVAERRAWHRQHKADMIDSFVANGVDGRSGEVHL